MPDPVLATQSGRWPARHLKNLKYDIYIIMIVFGFAADNRIMMEELIFRIRGLDKYAHLSRDDVREMLVQSTSISFLFSSSIEKYEYIYEGRTYDSVRDL